MPISACDGCPETHWAEVRQILHEAITAAGFSPNLVSDADDVGIIQKRIIQNIYENPIVVCDVSGKNSNVMFELGMRLAFDRPAIIIKDDKTSYSFDTAPIEHLEYPRDLRFAKMVAFRTLLSEKIAATHTRATTDPTYTTFLKHFGTFTVAKLETKEMPKDEYIIAELKALRGDVLTLRTAAIQESWLRAATAMDDEDIDRHAGRVRIEITDGSEHTREALARHFRDSGIRYFHKGYLWHLMTDLPPARIVNDIQSRFPDLRWKWEPTKGLLRLVGTH